MRRFLLLATTLLLSISFVGCETTSHETKHDSPQIYRGASFTVTLPPNVDGVSEQGDGFAVHYFRIAGSKTSMGVYEGQHPSLFSKRERDLTPMRRGTTFRKNIDRGDDTWGIDSNAKIWRESVWSCTRAVVSPEGKKYRLPSMIHVWYFGATEEEQIVLDSIVDTIEMID